MDRLELSVPPVALALACLAALWGASRWLPWLEVDLPLLRPVAIALVALGAGIGLAGVVEFRRGGTTVDPTRPGRASAVVDTGVYRWTRNPMYLALALGLAGTGAWLATLATVPVVALFVAWITRLQIVPEERALRAKFGPAYDRYASRVRRWL